MQFNFNVEPAISKKVLLDRASEEEYMEYYLGITPIFKKLYKSPLRVDNHPTCGFYRNSSGELIFHDFATNTYLNFIGVVMTKFSCTYGAALQIIASDFKISNTVTDKHVSIQPHAVIPKKQGITKIQIEVQPFTETELKWWAQYGIDQKILKKFNIYSAKHVFLEDVLRAKSDSYNMIFGYYGGKQDGKELWRIYFPHRHSYRFLSNWNAKRIQGIKQLRKTGNLLIITKSLKDVACLYSLGIDAIAPNSETLFIPDTMLEELKLRFKHLLCLYDNDEAGITNMQKIKEKYGINTYYIPLQYGAKDISDYHKKYGRVKTLKFVNKLCETYS